MRVAIVGCGLVGRRRAAAAASAGDVVAVAVDADEAAAKALSGDVGGRWATDWRDVARDDDVEAAVVATPNKYGAEIAAALLEAGKHVLCEKPLGRNAAEAAEAVAAARGSGRVLKVGFNHRHHPALSRAHELGSAGAIGPLLGIRAAYGHGGRPGYDREWRGDAELAGGGELLDQGVHVVDLCRWFLGDFEHVFGAVATWYWPVEPLEDNGFAIMRTARGQVASLHTSWTQWRNLFRFEVIGRDGYLIVDGLGGSYGVERLVVGTRHVEGAVPDEEEWRHEGGDVSWAEEWREFTTAVRDGREPLGNGEDGYAAAQLVDAIYESARSGAPVSVA